MRRIKRISYDYIAVDLIIDGILLASWYYGDGTIRVVRGKISNGVL